MSILSTTDPIDHVARIALAIQRAGADHLGPVENVHESFIAILSDLRAAQSAIAALTRELERWRHGTTIEDDYVCPDSLALVDAKAENERLRAGLSEAVSYAAWSDIDADKLSELRSLAQTTQPVTAGAE